MKTKFTKSSLLVIFCLLFSSFQIKAQIFSPTFTIAPSVCQGGSINVIANTGTYVSTYTWTSSGTETVVAPNSQSTTILFQSPGTVTISLSATSGGTNITTTNTILVNPQPNFTIVTSNTLLCTGKITTITASGANTYTWNIGPNTASIAVSPTVNTNYTLSGTSVVGCTNSTSFSQSVSFCYKKMLVNDTTTWQHFGIFIGVKSAVPNATATNNSLAAIDTITISGNKYKKLYELQIPAHLNYNFKTLVGYVREDTVARKIYFKENLINPEIVLYDFSLNVNDSTQLSFPNNPSANGYYRVDSIVTKTELCGLRKHFYLRKHLNNFNPTLFYYEWIESIGSSFHFLYPYSSGFLYLNLGLPSGCIHPWSVGLACKKNMNIQQYQSCTYLAFWNNYFSSCVYYYFYGGIFENSKISSLSVYPNPANDKLFVKINSSESIDVKIELFDVVGKLILKQSQVFSIQTNEQSININSLSRGVYFLKITSNGISQTIKVMKE